MKWSLILTQWNCVTRVFSFDSAIRCWDCRVQFGTEMRLRWVDKIEEGEDCGPKVPSYSELTTHHIESKFEQSSKWLFLTRATSKTSFFNLISLGHNNTVHLSIIKYIFFKKMWKILINLPWRCFLLRMFFMRNIH